jgi:sugar/nucleoside kinase (ribokinase family)
MQLACVGDNVVDVYTSLGQMFPGGNAVNVAVAARRAGMASSYLGAVGTDTAARVVMGALAAEGVEVTRTRVVEGRNAYCNVNLVDGDRFFGPSDVGVSRIELDREDLSYLAQFDLVHTGDTSMIEHQLNVIAEESSLSFDFGERPESYWRPLISLMRIACFSASRLSEEQAEEHAREVIGLGPELVLITMGDRGALAFDGDAVRWAHPSVTPLDTLGAGDSLIGTFLTGIVRGEDIGVALTAGSVAAAQTCLHYGAFGHGASSGLLPPGYDDAPSDVTSSAGIDRDADQGGAMTQRAGGA